MTIPTIPVNTSPDCPNSLCQGKFDGNYEVNGFDNYFLQCTGGQANCQSCSPKTKVFVERCNQCLNSKQDECTTIQTEASTANCPDVCPQYGPTFSGNVPLPSSQWSFAVCFNGITVECVAWPVGFEFNEKWPFSLILFL